MSFESRHQTNEFPIPLQVVWAEEAAFEGMWRTAMSSIVWTPALSVLSMQNSP